MEQLNNAFFFVTDKIISLKAFFIREAWALGQLVLLISILAAALNYALTGQGLKENIIKITKALLFFFIVMFAYPQIISYITRWTFERAHASAFIPIERSISDSQMMIEDSAARVGDGSWTYGQEILNQMDNPANFFSRMIQTRRFGEITYTVVAPAGAMAAVLLVAGECFRWARDTSRFGLAENMGRIIIGSLLSLS